LPFVQFLPSTFILIANKPMSTTFEDKIDGQAADSKRNSRPAVLSSNHKHCRSEISTINRELSFFSLFSLFSVIIVVAFSFWLGERSRAVEPGDCKTSPQSLDLIADGTITMNVRAGTECAIWARVMDSFVDYLGIESQPAHGTVRTRGLNGLIYSPNPGYVGDDSFSFMRKRSVRDQNNSSVIQVRVSVE
jgi:hypothetical protein